MQRDLQQSNKDSVLIPIPIPIMTDVDFTSYNQRWLAYAMLYIDVLNAHAVG